MRKNRLILYSLLLNTIPLLASTQEPLGVHFVDAASWSEVAALAKKENKPIFVDAYTTWCAPCRKMDLEIYTNAKVGDFFNAHFISVRVQIDSTKDDNAQLKAFYKDAKRLASQYQINAFPSFLFFNVDGGLIHRDIGFKQSADLILLAKAALRPQEQYYAQVAAFQKGRFDYKTLFSLESEARKNKNYKLADSIASALYTGYIKKLNKKGLLNKANLDFIQQHTGYPFISSGDLIFKLAIKDPNELSSITKFNGLELIKSVIVREELTNKIWKEGKLINSNPNWDEYRANMLLKKANFNIDSVILSQKINFYSSAKDELAAAKARTELVFKYPPAKTGLNVFFTLNSPAWAAFLSTNDPNVLAEALKWSELSMQLENSDQYIDTRANLLYKLGRVDEAIAFELKALEYNIKLIRDSGKPFVKESAFTEYLETLNKMAKGQQTWPTRRP